MEFKNLETNIIDVIKEQQIKLGYRSETVRLYYPIVSLNRFFGKEYTIEEMTQKLKEFSAYAEPRLGEVEVTNQGERFCLAVPPKGVDYIHSRMEGTEFLTDFIRTIEKHGCTIDDVLAQFHKYSSQVHFEAIKNGEFDYLIYFEEEKPDSYRYCLTDEGCHLIYHRFTKEDYQDFL